MHFGEISSALLSLKWHSVKIFSVGGAIIIAIKKKKYMQKPENFSKVEKLKTVQQGHIAGLITLPTYTLRVQTALCLNSNKVPGHI